MVSQSMPAFLLAADMEGLIFKIARLDVESTEVTFDVDALFFVIAVAVALAVGVLVREPDRREALWGSIRLWSFVLAFKIFSEFSGVRPNKWIYAFIPS